MLLTTRASEKRVSDKGPIKKWTIILSTTDKLHVTDSNQYSCNTVAFDYLRCVSLYKSEILNED